MQLVKEMITQLDHPYIKEHYKLIATDLSELQKLHADPKAMQQLILLEI